MRRIRDITADFVQQAWGRLLVWGCVALLGVPALAMAAAVWLFDRWQELTDTAPSRNVIRPSTGWDTVPQGYTQAWGEGARIRARLRTWCRENHMPLGQIESEVKAYFAELDAQRDHRRRAWGTLVPGGAGAGVGGEDGWREAA